MKNAISLAVLGGFFACSLLSLCGAEDSFRAPDSLVLKDGRIVRGLIVKNTSDYILLQEAYEEQQFPKSEIVRILDRPDDEAAYTGINEKGDLPAWRIVVNDLRTNDSIRSLIEIPATIIDNGKFQNVPYKSFRVNNDIELNIYGDPEDPAAIELGIYGSKSGKEKLRKMLRGYLAGFLTTREEVSKLYGLSFKGGIAEAGDIVLEITPKTAPDAYGAWWVSIFNKKKLSKARLSEKNYLRLVKPVDEVLDKDGRVKANGWSDEEMDMSRKVDSDDDRVLLKGFYRDKDGVFRLITEVQTTAAGGN